MKNTTIVELIIIIILAVILGISAYFTIKVINPEDETTIGDIMQEMQGNASSSVETIGATSVTDTQTLNGT